MKLAASVCLIPELASGPFLYAGDLGSCCQQAAAAGFDAVELLIPSPDAVSPGALRDVLAGNHLALSGISTGGGFLVHRLHLCSPDAQRRRAAVTFAERILDLAAPFDAPAIVGVLKGMLGPGVDRTAAREWLCEGLEELGEHAVRLGTSVVLEPLNRYESNWINRLDEGVELLGSLGTRGVRLLADLFHMNIEEASVTAALRGAAEYLGHVHWADSNRRAVGFGHLDGAAVGRTLREIGYQGYLTAEIFPQPSADAAARQAVAAFREHVGPERGSAS